MIIKNKKSLILSIAIMFSLSVGVSALDSNPENEVAVFVNDKLLNTYDEALGKSLSGFIYSDRTYLPLRKVFEMEVMWDGTNETVTATSNN